MIWFTVTVLIFSALYGLYRLGTSEMALELEDVINNERIVINKLDRRHTILSTPEGAAIAKAVGEKDFATIGATIAQLEAARFTSGEFYIPLYSQSYSYAMELLCEGMHKKWFSRSKIKEAHLIMDDLDRFLADHDDHVIVTMLSDMIQQVGYIYRGCDTIDNVSEKNIVRFADHYEQADALLDPYKGLKSPLLHRSRVSLFAGLNGGQKLLAERFQELVDTDPKDMSIYGERVWFLLPRWGGSWEQIELLARKCYAEDVNGFGSAMYAYIILKAAQEDLEMSSYWDDELFEQGMRDLAATGDQILVNLILGFIYESNYKTVETMYGQEVHLEKPNWDSVRSFIIRNNLHEVHTEVWCSDEDFFEMSDAKEMINQEFKAEFLDGITRIDFTGGKVRFFEKEEEVFY